MGALSARVKNADRMMTHAQVLPDGIELVFADGCKGTVPFADIPGIKKHANLAEIDLPNPYEVVLSNFEGETVELPWDFARHYCDPSYRPRVEATALAGRQVIGARIRQLRESRGLTQEALAQSADIGRVTLVRIEKGEQSPKYETLVSLARALKRPVQDLFARE